MKQLNRFIAFMMTFVLATFMSPLAYAEAPQQNDSENIYVYLTVTGDTEGLVLNNSGWYTIGKISAHVPNSETYKAEHPSTFTNYIHDYDTEIQNQIATAIERYSKNQSIDLSKADWSKKGLKVDQGANDYVYAEYVWHYDGEIDVKYLTHYTVSWVDTKGNKLADTIESVGFDGDTVSGDQKEFYGYKFVSTTGPITLDHEKNNTITFTYEKIPAYTVTWENYNGKVLEKDTDVLKGTIPTYDGHTPKREDSNHTSYEFTGWTPKIEPVTGNVTYTATYKAIPYPTYTITYDWGDFDKLPIPTDDNTYYAGDAFTVDAAYTSSTQYCVEDEYGNIKGIWQFSGWDTANSTIKGDLTIRGYWTYEVVEVPKWHITYKFTGEYPDGVIPPTDETEYVNGSTYELIPPAETLVGKYDDQGNKIGEYVFTRWDKEDTGTITGNITVTGKWFYHAINNNNKTTPTINKKDNNNQTATNSNDDSKKQSPQTGDILGYISIALVVVALICAALAFAIRLKRKNVI